MLRNYIKTVIRNLSRSDFSANLADFYKFLRDLHEKGFVVGVRCLFEMLQSHDFFRL